MTDENQRLLNELLVAQVLCLAAQLKAAKERQGVTSTSDYVQEAAALIKQKRERVLSLLLVSTATE